MSCQSRPAKVGSAAPERGGLFHRSCEPVLDKENCRAWRGEEGMPRSDSLNEWRWLGLGEGIWLGRGAGTLPAGERESSLFRDDTPMSLERSSEPRMGIAIAGLDLICYQKRFSGGFRVSLSSESSWLCGHRRLVNLTILYRHGI